MRDRLLPFRTVTAPRCAFVCKSQLLLVASRWWNTGSVPRRPNRGYPAIACAPPSRGPLPRPDARPEGLAVLLQGPYPAAGVAVPLRQEIAHHTPFCGLLGLAWPTICGTRHTPINPSVSTWAAYSD